MIRGHLLNGDTWVAFSDGSCLHNPGPAGAGALLVITPPSSANCTSELKEGELKTREKDYVSPQKATNNQMELKGIDLALDLLHEIHTGAPRSTWVILTDSDYVVGLLERGNKVNANAEIVHALHGRIAGYQRKLSVKITIKRVPAHCGIHFNECVDKLANSAAQQSKRQLARAPPIPQSKSPSELKSTSAASSASTKTPRVTTPVKLNHIKNPKRNPKSSSTPKSLLKATDTAKATRNSSNNITEEAKEKSGAAPDERAVESNSPATAGPPVQSSGLGIKRRISAISSTSGAEHARFVRPRMQ